MDIGSSGQGKRSNLWTGAITAIVVTALAAAFYLLFLALFWLRGPGRFLCCLASTGSLFALPIVWLGMRNDPSHTIMVLTLIAMGIGVSAIMWINDCLILWLAPDRLVLDASPLR